MNRYERSESNIGAILRYNKENRLLYFQSCCYPYSAEEKLSESEKGCLTAPLKIFIGITRNCNLNCPMCFSRRNENITQTIPTEIIMDLVQQCDEMKVFEMRLTGGEPTIHPDFFKISEAIANAGMTLSINTNGAYSDSVRKRLMQSSVDLFHVSIDGPKDIHNNLRGKGVFEEAVLTLYAIKESGKKGRINTMIFDENVDRIEEMVALAESVDFPIRFCPMRSIGSPESRAFSNHHILTDEQWETVKSQLKTLRQSFSIPILFFSNAELEDFESCEGISAGIEKARCAAWITQMGIDPEGYVYAGGCIDDIPKEISVGHLNDYTLTDLWNRVLCDVEQRMLPSFRNCHACSFNRLLPTWIQNVVCNHPNSNFSL